MSVPLMAAGAALSICLCSAPRVIVAPLTAASVSRFIVAPLMAAGVLAGRARRSDAGRGVSSPLTAAG